MQDYIASGREVTCSMNNNEIPNLGCLGAENKVIYRVSQKFCPMPNFEEHVTFERVDRISNAVPFWKAYGGSNLKIISICIEF